MTCHIKPMHYVQECKQNIISELIALFIAFSFQPSRSLLPFHSVLHAGAPD